MSWSAYLCDDRGHSDGEWGYTHNCGRMIYQAYEAATGTAISSPWWSNLDGASGADGRVFLEAVIRGLEADPARYRAMNPENLWGDYDSLLDTLRKMRDAVPNWPTEWSVYG